MLSSVPDFRDARGRRYGLAFILAVCVIASLAGAQNYREIASVAAAVSQPALCSLGAEWNYFTGRHEYPRRTTIWNALTGIDADELDRITGEWLLSQASRDREDDGNFKWVIALDGKVMKGAWTDENDQFTLFSAMLHREAVTIAQLTVPADTKETTQVKALTGKCAIPEGERVLATLDAGHANKKTTRLIGGKEGWDYLITVKKDKKALYRKAKETIIPFLPGPPDDIITSDGRGRTRTWSCWTADPGETEFPYLSQVACILRESFNSKGEKTSKEIALKVTSAGKDDLTAADLNRHARNHWGIENKSHWIRDTAYREDGNQTYAGNGPQALASLRNLAVSLLRLKGTEKIRETMQAIHLDRDRALAYMTTQRNTSYAT